MKAYPDCVVTKSMTPDLWDVHADEERQELLGTFPSLYLATLASEAFQQGRAGRWNSVMVTAWPGVEVGVVRDDSGKLHLAARAEGAEWGVGSKCPEKVTPVDGESLKLVEGAASYLIEVE